jgi:hypothetical protein
MKIPFEYYTYYKEFVSIDEETFTLYKNLLVEEPDCIFFEEMGSVEIWRTVIKKTMRDLIISIVVGIIASSLADFLGIRSVMVGFILGFISMFIGLVSSTINLYDELVNHDIFIRKLNDNFHQFETYEDYRNFVKFERL